MASPHGSRLREWIRNLANRFLTDSQRKSIKSAFRRAEALPRNALGVNRLFDAQSDEIARLKSKIILLEGKLNLALYGLPPSHSYQAMPVNNSLVNALEPLAASPPAFKPDMDLLKSVAATYRLERILISTDFGAIDISTLLSAWDGGGRPNEILAADPSSETMSTDLITALINRDDASLDGIFCLLRYQHLSPAEQERLVWLATRKLCAGGVLYLELPSIDYPGMLEDLYWRDPRNLRIYSLSRLKETLSLQAGRSECIGQRPDRATFAMVFQKGPA